MGSKVTWPLGSVGVWAFVSFGETLRRYQMSYSRRDLYHILPMEAILGAGEMVHWLRVLAALPEDPDSVLSTHMAACNCL